MSPYKTKDIVEENVANLISMNRIQNSTEIESGIRMKTKKLFGYIK